MSFEELMDIYYFPLIGINDYPKKYEFIKSVVESINSGTFSKLIVEYNLLKTHVLLLCKERFTTPSKIDRVYNFNRMRFHIQIEISKLPGSPVFEYFNF